MGSKHHEEPAQNVVLSLFYNGERVAQKTISSIAGNESQHVTLDGPARGSGIVQIRAELEPDALPFDNARFAVINVPVSPGVLGFSHRMLPMRILLNLRSNNR